MSCSFCPECMRMVDCDIIERPDTFTIRGEDVTVGAQIAVCPCCGEEIGVEALDNVAFLAAYAVYRARHDLLQPEQIRAIRSKYGLGQKAFARLLGWGDVTVSRYETGSLQSVSHDQALRLAEDPDTVRRLLARGAARLSAEQRTTLDRRLAELSTEHEDVLAREENAAYGASPGVRRLREMMVYFAEQPHTWRTKLNKMLFYADFLHFKRHGEAISGARYVHMQFGPVPVDFYTLHAALADDASVNEVPMDCGDYEGTVFAAARPADRSVFSDEELRTMADVTEHFSGWSARQVTEFSHREPAWLETKDRETIPYDHAAALQLD
jgi:putative zinc finger/helix-turn-helix YgiT family protein